MVERHLQILSQVIANEPIGIVKLSNRTGYPHHKVRYSLRQLEEEGLVEPSSQGAITTDRARAFVEELESQLREVMERIEAMNIHDVEEPNAEGQTP